jgi:hypothetical protein
METSPEGLAGRKLAVSGTKKASYTAGLHL